MPRPEPSPFGPNQPKALQSTHLRFDADTHATPQERAAGWRNAMSVSMDIRYGPGDIDGFAGALDLYPLGPTTLGVIQGTAHTAVRTKVMANRWAYNHVAIDLFSHGTATGDMGGRPVAVGPGDCLMVDLRDPMHLRLGDIRCVTLVMPRRLFDLQAGGYLAVDGLVFPADSPEARLLGPALETLVGEAPRLSRDLATTLGVGLTGLVAACARAHVPVTHGPKPRPTTPSLAHLQRAIGRRAADPAFDAETLATQAGVSRATLSRVFAPVGGVAEAIRRARVDLAMARFGDAGDAADDGLAAVARASGFADTQALRRALKAVHGITPREARGAAEALPDETQPMAREWTAYLDTIM